MEAPAAAVEELAAEVPSGAGARIGERGAEAVRAGEVHSRSAEGDEAPCHEEKKLVALGCEPGLDETAEGEQSSPEAATVVGEVDLIDSAELRDPVDAEVGDPVVALRLRVFPGVRPARQIPQARRRVSMQMQKRAVPAERMGEDLFEVDSREEG